MIGHSSAPLRLQLYGGPVGEPALGPTAFPHLAIESRETFTLAQLQGGYTRYLQTWNGLKPGVGAGLSAGIVPDSLKSTDGRRLNLGFGVFVTLRAAERGM